MTQNDDKIAINFVEASIASVIERSIGGCINGLLFENADFYVILECGSRIA